MTDGPGKLCQALAIDRSFNEADLVNGIDLFIERAHPVDDDKVVTTPRVGVRGDDVALTVPWRFVIAENDDT